MARQPIILDDDDDLPRPRPKEKEKRESREGFESGLASTVIGATFLIIGMLAPMLNFLLKSARDGYGNVRHESGVVDIVLLLSIAIVEIICIMGVVLATRGLKHARIDKNPTGMPVAGLMLCLCAIFLWMLIGLGTVSAL
jgi:uncharacterized membrane protein